MKTVEIQTRKSDANHLDLEAEVFDGETLIVSATHGGEGYIVQDWGFCSENQLNMDNQYSCHRKIWEHFQEPVILKWKEYAILIRKPLAP